VSAKNCRQAALAAVFYTFRLLLSTKQSELSVVIFHASAWDKAFTPVCKTKMFGSNFRVVLSSSLELVYH
jgi:hypothetical protein